MSSHRVGKISQLSLKKYAHLAKSRGDRMQYVFDEASKDGDETYLVAVNKEGDICGIRRITSKTRSSLG